MRNWQSTAIDNARATLVIGLIVYHSARVFDPFVFYVKAPEQFVTLGPLILFGAIWGMPLFFFAAGFALWHSLGGRAADSFVRDRVKRLLLPLAAGMLTLVPLQVYITRRAAGEHISYLESMRQFFSIHLTLQFPFPVQGLWFDYSHLWFLAYLFAFSLILLPAVLWARRRPDLGSLPSRAALAIWVVAIVGVADLESSFGMEGTGAWNRWTYLVFMSIGVMLACQPRFGEVLARRRHLLVVGAFISFVALVVASILMQDDLAALTNSHALGPALWRTGKGISGMLFLMAIVASLVSYRPAPAKAAQRRATPVSAFLAYVKPISLPLYLLHQTVIVVMAYWIVQLSIPAPAQFLAIVVLTLAFSISTIELALRSRLGSLLLGMKYDPQRRLLRSRRRIRKHEAEQVPGLLSSSA